MSFPTAAFTAVRGGRGVEFALGLAQFLGPVSQIVHARNVNGPARTKAPAIQLGRAGPENHHSQAQ
jgi:hypothetical protein